MIIGKRKLLILLNIFYIRPGNRTLENADRLIFPQQELKLKSFKH